MSLATTPLRIDKGSAQLLKDVHDLGSGDILKCYQCGTCVGECPAVSGDLHVRRLIKFCIYGLEGPIMESTGVWACTTCHLCSERCPEGASPFELVMAIRRFHSQHGLLPKALKEVMGTIIATGHAVEVEDKHKKARKAVGLPELPPTMIGKPDMVEEVRRIVHAREVSKQILEGGDG